MSNVQMQVSDQTLHDYDLLRDDCGLIDLPHLALVTIKGDDRKGWLQGQATNDLRKLEPGASNTFCVVAISGHLVSVCEVWAAEDRLLLTCPKLTLKNLLHRVEQMVIMEDVTANDASDQYTLLSIQGPTATARLSSIMSLPSLDTGQAELNGANVYVLRSNRTGLGGWDLWIESKETRTIARIKGEFASIGAEAYDIARLEAGIPLFGADMGERTFPPEMGPAFETKYVSYSKGCYMGQEVLMRIHSRGHTNRTWVGLRGDSPIEIGASVVHARRPDAGIVTSATFSPDFGYIGAAMVRNEAAFEGETVTIQKGEVSVDAEIRLMPIMRFA